MTKIIPLILNDTINYHNLLFLLEDEAEEGAGWFIKIRKKNLH